MHLEAIIFDVDGTLADTEEIHRRAFNRAFADSGLAWQWDVALYRELLGVTGGRERITHYAIDNDPGFAAQPGLESRVAEVHRRKTNHYVAQINSGEVSLRPGVRDLIEQAEAAGLKLAIATTTSPANIDALCRINLGADWRRRFAVVEDARTAPTKKPDPMAYHQAIERLGCAADRCLAIEDSANGLQAALAAGIATIISQNRYTDHHAFDGALAVYDDLGDVTLDTLIHLKNQQEAQLCPRSA